MACGWSLVSSYGDKTVDLVFDKWENRPPSNSQSLCRVGYSDGAAACTDLIGIDNGTITIYMKNPDGHPLDVAADILHEGVHAAIAVYLNNLNIDVRLLRKDALLYYYDYFQNSNADADHYYMTQVYINPIAKALRQLDNFTSPLENYYPFAWEGLTEYGLEQNLTYDQVYFYVDRTSTRNNSILCKN